MLKPIPPYSWLLHYTGYRKRDSICISSYLPFLSYIMVQYSFPTSGSHSYGYTLKNGSIEKNINKFWGFITLMKHNTVLALSLLGELPEDVA